MYNTGYVSQTTFASDMGLAPGRWPTSLEFQGNTFFFHRKDIDREGELAAVIYRNGKLCRDLVVYND